MELCTKCPKGKFQPEVMQPSCLECAAGNYTDVVGLEECLICPLGRVTETPGKPRCSICLAGSFAESTARCTMCPKGKFVGRTGRTECEECQPGYFAEADGSRAQVLCPVGKFTNTYANSKCDICETGLYSVSPLFCASCPAGKHNHLTMQEKCIFCKKGSFMAASASTFCSFCPEGKFTVSAGGRSCTLCKGGSFAKEQGQTSCWLCPKNYFTERGTAGCDACEEGKLSDPGQDTCLPKPVDNSGMVMGIALTSTAVFIACLCIGLKRGNKHVTNCATKCIIGGLETVLSESEQRSLIHHVKQHQHHRRLSMIMAANEEEEMRRRDIQEMKDAEDLLNRTVDFMNYEEEAIATGVIPAIGSASIKALTIEEALAQSKDEEVRNPTMITSTAVVPIAVNPTKTANPARVPKAKPGAAKRRNQIAPAGLNQ